MLTKVEIRPVVGSPLEVNTTDGSGNHVYPLSQFDINVNIDTGQPAKKMAAPGEWPRFHYPGAQVIVAGGRILGVGASDSARSIDYVTKRLALLDAITPPMTSPLTSRIHAVLRVRMDGMTEDADVDVCCISRAVPMVALHAANSEFLITWTAFEPFFTGVTNPNNQYILG